MVVGNKMLTETHSISGYLYKKELSSSIVGEGGTHQTYPFLRNYWLLMVDWIYVGLLFFGNLTQARVIWEQKQLNEKLFSSQWPVNLIVGAFS